MRYRITALLGALGALILVTSLGVTTAAQTQGRTTAATPAWTPSHTLDGQPDLQGMWINFESTPFEKPDTPARGGGGGGGAFGDKRPIVAARPAMVVDPPEGKVPVMAWAEQKRDEKVAHSRDSWEYLTPWEQCITRGIPAGIFPGAYGDGYQIVQGPGYVAILYEMIHEPRIIPVDGSPHLPANIRLWNGDSRGHWEGNTLVVDITNYNDRGIIASSVGQGRIRGIPQTEQLHVVERFTPVAANTINYEVTIDDPKVYTRPWKVSMPLTRDDSFQMFEYACHEGNRDYMELVLGAGRANDKLAEDAAKKK